MGADLTLHFLDATTMVLFLPSPVAARPDDAMQISGRGLA